MVSPFPADRQASGSQAESSWQKQKSISSLPGPGEQSLQVSLAQAHPTAAGGERDIPGTGRGGWGACAGSRGLAHLGFWSRLGSGAPFLPPTMRPGETHPALLGGLGGRKTQTQRGFLLGPLEQLSSSHTHTAPEPLAAQGHGLGHAPSPLGLFIWTAVSAAWTSHMGA